LTSKSKKLRPVDKKVFQWMTFPLDVDKFATH